MGDLYRISVRVKTQLDQLTERGKQVVDGFCQGSAFKPIARKLSFSPSTVSNHLYRIYLTLNINTRSELVTVVIKGI
ncbi:MAG: response regulator transcription factor [Alteromonadaceae bacterium]|nr:response regulator transcription factor [Alteromonadaceae bacterium]